MIRSVKEGKKRLKDTGGVVRESVQMNWGVGDGNKVDEGQTEMIVSQASLSSDLML